MPHQSLRTPNRDEVVRCVATRILPHEAAVRAWLRRSVAEPAAVGEIIHEACCRLSELVRIDHIEMPRAYFFTTVRSILLERLGRSRIVPIGAMSDLNADRLADDRSSPEAIAARIERDRVLARRTYIGEHQFNRCSKTKELKPDSEVVTVPVPPLIDIATFETVQALMKARNRKTALPHRVVIGPTCSPASVSAAIAGVP